MFWGEATLIEAKTHRELETACSKVEGASRSGHVILLMDYEIGSWFEPKLKILPGSQNWAPFQAWLFSEVTWLPRTAFDDWLDEYLGANRVYNRASGIAGISSEISASDYVEAAKSALEYIAAGEIYQINLTWRIDFAHFGSSLALYRKLRRSQPVNYGAYLVLPERAIVSLSPELFFERKGDQLIARPMKGTRSRSADNDTGGPEALIQSEKDRAENLMIVDLIRNDLGKIAEPGSVGVDYLFRVEEYPTVYQMVSQVSARVRDRSLYSTLAALFPCGSVTGAPKIRAMEIINRLEGSARGIYTGSIGHIRPGGDCCFNVAIRTLELFSGNRGSLHVGSAIVADSSPTAEYEECWAKARFLTGLEPDFTLFETLLFDNGEWMRLKAHLERLQESALFFGFKYNESVVRRAIARMAEKIGEERCGVKLTLQFDGTVDTQIRALPELASEVGFVIADQRTESTDLLLRHKTSARKLYDDTLAQLRNQPAVFDALFFNEKGELTEGARSNVFLIKDGTWFTPPIESGLLNGVMRREILNTHLVREQKLYGKDLTNADAVLLSNALRGLIQATLI